MHIVLTSFLWLTVSVLLGAAVRWSQVRKYWKKRNVPHDAPNPFMGSLTFLQRENPATFMKNLYKKFSSPYVGIWLFWRPALVINCPDIARRILVKDFDVFRNRYLRSGKTDPIGAHTLFLVDDPIWSSIRRRLTIVFTAAKLRALTGLTQNKAADLVYRIKTEMEKGAVENLRIICSDYTTDVIGEAAFGVASETTRTGDSIMRRVTREFMTFNVQRGFSWSSIFFFPELVDIFGFSLFPKHTTEFLRQILRSIIEQRGGHNRDIGEPRDLLDALFKIQKEGMASGEELSEDLLLAQAAIFLLGGFDTSGSVMTWAILEMSHNPKLQDKLYNELMEAKQKLGGKDFDPTTLAELPFLNAVIKETLRKFPPMGWLDRMASRDYVVDDNLTIPAGSVVYVNAIGLHWDPKFFPNPEKFDPNRFMPENEGNIKPYTYMPFGEGPRNCIGFRFGYQTVRFGLSAIFSNFEVRPLPNTPLADDTEVEKKGMFLMPGQQISVQFIPRNNNIS
ncbi:cytochrome P450 6k1 isoform X1 [Manduca sexta]|uniref:cytochrome P450 6k1 isoform X1 n=1 Tax=Manduca sexta TaxID=7130 RepID=UPI00188ED34A|nr:cytochrome P450 6k1 isoform X1 [Manduca sexta]